MAQHMGPDGRQTGTRRGAGNQVVHGLPGKRLPAFGSQTHQGNPTNLQVIHNTFINSGRAVSLSSWSGAASMVFANNVCYSQSSQSVQVSGGEMLSPSQVYWMGMKALFAKAGLLKVNAMMGPMLPVL